MTSGSRTRQLARTLRGGAASWMLAGWAVVAIGGAAFAGDEAKAPAHEPAGAAPPAPAAPAPAPAEAESGSNEAAFTGEGPLRPIDREPRSPEQLYQIPPDLTMEQYSQLPLPWKAYVGAQMLHLEPEFVYGVQQGLQLVYERKYNEARDHFSALDTQYTHSGIRSVADVIVWQALMLENFDFRYDKQYWTSSKQARKELEAAIALPGNDAWEQLLWASVVGIESIHTMRQGNYLSALQLAFQAMDAIEKCRTAAPEFVDLKLADGMYNYWRSVVTMSSKVLPDFGDHRVEGIEQMQIVEARGVLVGPLASLSLAFSWLEENDLKRAASSVGINRRDYPDNIINNMVAAMVYNSMHRYPDALEVLDHIVQTDAANDRVHYWRGVTLQKQGQLDPAIAEYERYLTASHLEDYQKSYALYRLGQIYSRKHEYSTAMEKYKAAIQVDGNKPAKAAKERLEERKKEGKIDF